MPVAARMRREQRTAAKVTQPTQAESATQDA
jgi:hypothetical protein